MTTPSLRDAIAEAMHKEGCGFAAAEECGTAANCPFVDWPDFADAALKVVAEWLRSDEATNVGHQATLAIYGHPYTESVEDAAAGLVNHALADALTKEGGKNG